MTADWLERELAAAIRQLQLNMLLAMRAAIDAVLATYEPPMVVAPGPTAGDVPAGSPGASAPPSRPALAEALRSRIAEFVRARPRSSATEIARAMSMHVGTVRPYLAMLVADGWLRLEPSRPEAPGRPAHVYLVVAPGAASEPSDAASTDAAPAPDPQEAQP